MLVRIEGKDVRHELLDVVHNQVEVVKVLRWRARYCKNVLIKSPLRKPKLSNGIMKGKKNTKLGRIPPRPQTSVKM